MKQSEIEESAPSAEDELAYQAQIQKDLPRNFAANLFHGMLGLTGFRLMHAPTFVPAYVYLLSGSSFAVGLVLASQFIGMAASSIWGATLIEHRDRVMKVVFAVGWMMRIQIFGLAASAFFLDGEAALWAAVIFLALFGFFGGMQNVTFNFLMSKVIPTQQRGRLLGLRNFLGGIIASGVAYLGGEYLVGGNFMGNGYASTFMLAFILTSLGITALSFVREPVSLIVRKNKSSFISRIKDIPQILKHDINYRRYFYARAFGALGTVAVPFYILHAGQVVNLTGTTIAYFSLSFLLSQTVSNLIWGRLADAKGYRITFLISMIIWCCATILLIAGNSMWLFIIAFCGLGAGFGGYMLAAQNFVLEFGKSHELPMLIAISDTASHLMMAIGPLIGGAIASFYGFLPIFVLAIIFKMTSAKVIFDLSDPRTK